MSQGKFTIDRRQVKFLIPAVGLIGIYLGAFVGMLVLSRRTPPPARLTMLLVEGVLGLIGGFFAMLPLDSHIGENASHVDLLKIPWYWTIAGVALYVAGWFMEKATPWALAPWVSNLALYAAGVFAIWVDEPASDPSPSNNPGR